jgi:hypothetical protein
MASLQDLAVILMSDPDTGSFDLWCSAPAVFLQYDLFPGSHEAANQPIDTRGLFIRISPAGPTNELRIDFGGR